jgi:hypothetical protein
MRDFIRVLTLLVSVFVAANSASAVCPAAGCMPLLALRVLPTPTPTPPFIGPIDIRSIPSAPAEPGTLDQIMCCFLEGRDFFDGLIPLNPDDPGLAIGCAFQICGGVSIGALHYECPHGGPSGEIYGLQIDVIALCSGH